MGNEKKYKKKKKEEKKEEKEVKRSEEQVPTSPFILPRSDFNSEEAFKKFIRQLKQKPMFDPRRSPHTLGETLLEDRPLQRKIKIQGPEEARAKFLKFFIKVKSKATFDPRSS